MRNKYTVIIMDKFPVRVIHDASCNIVDIEVDAYEFGPEESKRIRKEALEYLEDLKKISYKKISQLHARILKKQQAKRKQPLVPCRSLNELDAINESFKKYAKQPLWTLDITAALVLGLNPQFYNMDIVGRKSDLSEEERLNIESYMEMRGYLLDHFNKDLERNFSSLGFIEWAQSNKLKLPEKLVNLALNKENEEKDYERLYKDKCSECEALQQSLDAMKKKTNITKTENKEKLILSMAFVGYGYDPSKKRNEANPCQDIANDFHSVHGETITDETVRDYLKEIHEKYPTRENS